MHSPDNRAGCDEERTGWSNQVLYGPASRWLRWLVAENLKLVEAGTISKAVDVGCGEGTTTASVGRLLSDAAVRVIDSLTTGIAAALGRYVSERARFVVDESSLHLRDSGFDLVAGLEVLEHGYDWTASRERFCCTSRRYVMLSFPAGRMRPFDVSVGDVRNSRRGEVGEFMAGVGFGATEVPCAGFPFYRPFCRDSRNLTDAANHTSSRGAFGLGQPAVSAAVAGARRAHPRARGHAVRHRANSADHP